MRAVTVTFGLLWSVACGPARSARNDTITWPDTSEAEWVATSIGGYPLVPGTRVTMQTTRTGIGGYSGCNWYGLKPDSARMQVEMTARGCRSDIQDQEHRFTLLLPQARSAVRLADTLVLLDRVPSELITFVRRHKTASNPAQLLGDSWRLVSTTVERISPDSVIVRFAADSASGFGGCRDFDATYTARDDELRFTSIAMRTLDCSRERARVSEEHLTTLLSETQHFEIRHDTLVLTTFGGDTARFSRIGQRRR